MKNLNCEVEKVSKGERVIIKDDKGKQYELIRVLDLDTEKVINDLSALVVKKDKIISEMADYIKNPSKSVYLPQIFKVRMGKREAIIKYFEERCK